MARYDWERGHVRRGGYDSSYGGRGGPWWSGAGGSSGVNWGGYRPRPWSRESGGSRFGAGYDRGVYGGGYPTFGGYPGGRQPGMYYGGDRYGEDLRRPGGGYGGQAPSGYGRGTSFHAAGGGYGGGPGGGYGAGWGGYGRDMDSGYGRMDQGGAYGGGYGGYGGGRGGYGGGFGVSRGGAEFERGGRDAGYARDPFLPAEAYRRHPEMEWPREHAHGRWPDHGHEPDFEEDLDDGEVEQAVRSKLHQDRWVHADRIEVEVSDGVVTLRGEVEDYMQARYAWDDAWDTAGVRGVINSLTVRTDQPQETHGDVVPQSSGGSQ